MKKDLPERHRIKGKFLEQDGVFLLPHNKINAYKYQVLISSGLGWEHLSVTLIDYRKKSKGEFVKRCCTWGEMCYLKELFFEDDEAVIQIHPPKEDNVSTHPYCLHLWRPLKENIPLPPSIMVGFKGDNNQSL